MQASGSDIVLDVRVPQKYRYLWPAITVAVLAVAILMVIFDRSWVVITLAAMTVGVFVWINVSFATAIRARRGAANQLALTAEGLRSPLFSLDWEMINHVWIGETSAQTGSLRALFIEPSQPSDIRWVQSRMIGANRWISEKVGHGQLQVLQMSIEMPLEQLVSEMERRAGRRLTGG